MNLKKIIPLHSLIVALVISCITIMLLTIISQNSMAQNSLGIQLLTQNTSQTQTANSVTSIVTYFRSLDTLGEITILFLAIFGISITIENFENKLNIFSYQNKLLQIGSQVIFPLIILFGFYIIFHGHLSPGGGFQGGVIIASGFLLNFLAFGNHYSLNHRLLKLFESLSGAGVVIIGILGFIVTNQFFGNFLPLGDIGTLLSGGVIPLIYIFVGLKVALEITVLVEYFIKGKEDV